MPGTAGATVVGIVASVTGLTGVGLAIAVGITQTVLVVGASIALSKVSSLLSPALAPSIAPSIAPSLAETASGRVLTFRQPITSRRVIYGEVRVSGVLTFIEGTPDNEDLYQVITLAGHPVEEIGEVYIDGEPVTLDSDGAVTSGPYARAGDIIIQIFKGLGTEAGDAEFNDALMSRTTGWTENHKQTGCAKVFVALHYDRGKRFVGAMPVLSFRVKGKQVFDPRDSQTRYSNNPVLCLRDYLLDTDFGLGESDSRIGPAFLSSINISEERIPVNVSREFTADVAIDTITLSSAAAGFKVSDLVLLSTDGTLPGGLAPSTEYFLIPVTDTDFKLAVSFENAAQGITIDITDAGSGIHRLVRQSRETFTADASSNEITLSSRIQGLETGDGVEVSSDGTLPGGLVPFSPTDFSGLSFWQDADDASTLIASGNDLSDWNDKGSGNIDFTQSGVARPKTGINTINGRNVINFDGSNHFMAASSSTTIKMIFIVAKIESGFPALAGLFNKAGTDDENLRMNSTNLELRGNGVTNSADFTDPSGEMRINGVVSVPPAIAVNTPFIISAVSPGAPTFIPQISQDFLARYWKGDIAEVIAYDTELSSANRIQVEQYLVEKWITPVPTAHFYIRKTDKVGLIASSYANALAGIAIDITDGGTGTHTLHRTTEPRYTCNGTFDTNQTPEGIIGQLLSAVNGSLVYQSGFWNPYIAFEPPTLDALDEGDLDGPIQVSTLISKRDLFNGVKGQFSSVDKDFVPTDFPAVTNATYLDEDGGERIWQDIDLPFTTSSSMAQRLAKIQLEKVRQQISVVLSCKLKVFRFQAGDTIKINNTRFGWVEKLFSIEDWKFAIRQGGGAPQLGIDLFCRETAPEVYDWNSGEETRIDIAPNTNLPDPFTVLPPTGLIAIEELYIARQGGGVKARVRLTWTASLDAFVFEYEVQFKLLTEPEFEVKGTTRDINFLLEDLTPGVYVFRVFSINTLAVKSLDFVEQNLEVLGLLAPPLALQNLTISTIGGLAIIRWDLSPDLDVREGGRIVFRHSSLFGGASWSESVSIGDAIPGTETVVVLPLKPGTYLARAIDASNISGPVVSFETTQATALEYTNVNILSEHPVFAGDKTNLVVDAGSLSLDGTLNIDAWPDFDAVADFDSEGGVAPNGTYIFDGAFDFGSVVRVRLTVLIEALIVNVLDDIDSRLNNIDDWIDFDGTEAADADVKVFVRHTNDDPGGSPTFSEYQRLDSAEFNAMAFEFKAEFTTNDPSYNIEVSQLTITADEVA